MMGWELEGKAEWSWSSCFIIVVEDVVWINFTKGNIHLINVEEKDWFHKWLLTIEIKREGSTIQRGMSHISILSDIKWVPT